MSSTTPASSPPSTTRPQLILPIVHLAEGDKSQHAAPTLRADATAVKQGSLTARLVTRPSHPVRREPSPPRWARPSPTRRPADRSGTTHVGAPTCLPKRRRPRVATAPAATRSSRPRWRPSGRRAYGTARPGCHHAVQARGGPIAGQQSGAGGGGSGGIARRV